MKFNIEEFIEKEDGSADVRINLDDEMKCFLINHAFIDILDRALSDFKKDFPDDTATTD